MKRILSNKKVLKPLFFFILYLIFLKLVSSYAHMLGTAFGKDIKINFIILNAICIGIIYIAVIVVKNIKTTIQNSKIEVEGTNLKKKDGTFGTADWGDIEDIKEYLSVGKQDGIVIGKTEDNAAICIPNDTYLNKNIAVFGASGSRKSRAFAVLNALMLGQMQEKIGIGNSLIFTDPKRRAL